jgi:hypothetical protein
MRSKRRLVLVALVVVLKTTHAADLGATYPPGSITTREQAQQALAAARAAERDAENTQRAELQACSKVFLQNRCSDDARRKFDAQRREIRRVEVEAREVRRRLDAEERAARRGPTEGKDKTDKAGSAGKPAATREPSTGAAEQAARDKQAAANRERYQKRLQEHEDEQADRRKAEAEAAAQRQANAKAYEEKQRAAAAYAKRREEERKANEKRREERRLERERKQKELEGQAKG